MLTATVTGQISLDPFPGLRSFTSTEAHLFFGRDGQSDEIVQKLARSFFVAITGNSGSGKSSLAKAGLLPSLCSGYLVNAAPQWCLAELRPRNKPLENLSQALAGAGLTQGIGPDTLRSNPGAIIAAARPQFSDSRRNLLILVDQFEELFRFKARPDNATADRDEKDCFVHLLLEAAAQREVPIYVVITLRSDFLGDCSQFRNLPERINDSQYLIPRLTREQRRLAIEGPIHVAGAEIAPRLVQRLLNEIGDDPDQLPVLQHALMRTWNDWRERDRPRELLDFEHYEAIGTLERAISQHADEALADACSHVGSSGSTIVERVFQRLTDKDQHGRETRRPTSVRELQEVAEASPEQIVAVLECFRRDGRSFLTPLTGDLSDDTEIDITHECLLRKWDQLRNDWTREEEESRRNYVRIAVRAEEAFPREKEDEGRAPREPLQKFSEYLHGSVLEQSVEWWNERKPNKSWASRYHSSFDLAREYLDASMENSEKQKRLKALQDEKIRLSARRKRIAYLFAAVAIVVAVVSVFVVMKFREKSRIATVRLLASKAATAASENDTLLNTSALLAAASVQREWTLDGQVILSKALVLLPSPLPILRDRRALAVELNPDGSLLAVGGEGGVDLVDTKTGEKRVLKYDGSIRMTAFGGPYLLAVSDNRILVWTVADGKNVAALPCDGAIGAFSVSGNGLSVVAQCGHTYFWQAGRDWTRPQRQMLPQPGDVEKVLVALSQDGKRLASEYEGIISTVIEVKNLSAKKNYTIHKTSPSRQIIFNPSNSDELVTAEADGTLKSWAYTQQDLEPSPLLKSSSATTHVSFSSEGWVAVSARDGSAKVWDTLQGYEIARLIIDGPISWISVSKAAQQVAAVAQDGSVHRWRLSGTGDRTYVGRILRASLTSDASYLLASLSVRDRILLDIATGRRRSFPTFEKYPAAVSPDGNLVAMFSGKNALGVNRFSGGEIEGEIWQHDVVQDPDSYRADLMLHFSGLDFRMLRFSPDSHHLAVGIRGLRAGFPTQWTVWNAENGNNERSLPWGRSSRVTFSPDSRSLFLSGSSGLQQFDIASGREMPVSWQEKNHFSVVEFSPDGRVGIGLELPTIRPLEDEDTIPRPTVVHIFNFPEGRERQRRLEQPGVVVQIAFSRDSRYLLTASTDNTVRLWDLESQTEIARVPTLSHISAVALTSDLRIVVVDQSRVTVNFWRTDDLIKDLCGRLPRNLTETEWHRYVPEEPYGKVCPALP